MTDYPTLHEGNRALRRESPYKHSHSQSAEGSLMEKAIPTEPLKTVRVKDREICFKYLSNKVSTA